MKMNYVYIGIFVFVIFVGIIVFVYFKGKHSAEPPKVHYQNSNGAGLPAGWEPLPLVDQLYNTMKGLLNSPLKRDAAWINLAKLETPDMVRNIYDIFNQIHFSEGNGTLTQWIKDESVLGWPSTAKDAALNALAQLKLI